RSDARRAGRRSATADNVASPSKVFPPSSVTTMRTFIAASSGIDPPLLLLYPPEVRPPHLTEHLAGERRHRVVVAELLRRGLHSGEVLRLFPEEAGVDQARDEVDKLRRPRAAFDPGVRAPAAFLSLPRAVDDRADLVWRALDTDRRAVGKVDPSLSHIG